MSPLLAVAAFAALLQTPVQSVDEPTPQLLAAAVNHMNARRLDSAAVLLRRVGEGPTRAASDRVRAWIMLGVVEYYRSGDSAASAALRQALQIDPTVQVAALDSTYPQVAALLAAERTAVAGTPAPLAAEPVPDAGAAPQAPAAPEAQAAPEAPELVDCTTKCPEGASPPYFTYFPQLDFLEGGSAVGAGISPQRRLRAYLLVQGVISTEGIMERETVQVMGGNARSMERDARLGLAQARFGPARTLEGLPVRARVTVRFDFEAEGTSWIKYTYRITAR